MFGPRIFRASESVAGRRFDRGAEATANDVLAGETAVALVYNGTPHVVMMATPQDIGEFALGFSLTEGIVHAADEFLKVRVRTCADGIEADIHIAPARMRELAGRRRNLTGRVGCGLCGAQSLAQAIRPPSPVADTLRLAPQALQRALARLGEQQALNRATGAVHAAAWVDTWGTIAVAREDIGRHNALDKLIGAMVHARIGFGGGAALITSRASYEMVQKAAAVGIQAVCAVSAPTALAVRVAEAARVTLMAFAREGRHTVYTHPQRIVARVEGEAA